MACSALKSVTLISSPYHVGLFGRGVGAGPSFIRSLGLLSSLQNLGICVSEVELEPVDEFEGEIGRSFELIRRTSLAVSKAHDYDSFPIILSGNCSAAVGVAAGYNGSQKASSHDKDLACVWLDAHDDFNTPDTVMSGYFDSQPIAMLAGECWKGLLGTVPGHTPMQLRENLIHVGMRDVNNLERQRVLDAGFKVIWGNNLVKPDFAECLQNLLSKRSYGPTMVHFDLDAMDNSLGKANQFSVPGGLLEKDLQDCLHIIADQANPVSLTIASFDPSYERAENIGRIAVEAVVSLIERLLKSGRLERQH